MADLFQLQRLQVAVADDPAAVDLMQAFLHEGAIVGGQIFVSLLVESLAEGFHLLCLHALLQFEVGLVGLHQTVALALQLCLGLQDGEVIGRDEASVGPGLVRLKLHGRTFATRQKPHEDERGAYDEEKL